MSTDKISVDVEKRSVIRKGLNNLRGEGKVPGVIHNHGKESIHISGDRVRLSKVYSEAGGYHPIELSIDGKKMLTLIKDADFEPTKHRLRHVVFQAIRQNETVTAEVPLVLEGDIPAERQGLMVITSLDTVEIEALPKDLVDELKVDATGLKEVGDRLSVSEVQVPEGITILSDPESGIAHVEMPRDQVAEADAAAAELAADAEGSAEEPEQIGEEESAEEAGSTEETEEQ